MTRHTHAKPSEGEALRVRFGVVLFALLIWVGATAPTWAQKLPFATSNIRDGMVDSVVFCMEQDSRGFLWIGTEESAQWR